MFASLEIARKFVEQVEVYGTWGAQAMEQARADAEWRAYVEGLA